MQEMKCILLLLLIILATGFCDAGDGGIIGYLEVDSVDSQWSIEGDHIDGGFTRFLITRRNGEPIKIDLNRFGGFTTLTGQNESSDPGAIILFGVGMDPKKPGKIAKLKLTIYEIGEYKVTIVD